VSQQGHHRRFQGRRRRQHNWSSNGVTRNRDASLAFHEPTIAKYYEEVFLYDWNTLAHERIASEAAMPQVGAGSASAAGGAGGAVMPWSRHYRGLTTEQGGRHRATDAHDGARGVTPGSCANCTRWESRR